VTEAQRELQKLCRPSPIAARPLKNPNSYESPWSLTPPAGDESKLTEPQYFSRRTGHWPWSRPAAGRHQFLHARAGRLQSRNEVLAELWPQFPRSRIRLPAPRAGTDEMAASDDDSTGLLVRLAGVAVLTFVVYRGFRYPLLTVSTLLIGTFVALAGPRSPSAT